MRDEERTDESQRESETDRQTEKRGCMRPVCVSPGSGPYVACFNTPLHHLSQSHITVKG